jgi:15-cis-phytoene synthase
MESVNDSLNPLHRLIISYAKGKDRQKFGFLFAFDARLAEVIRTTSEPLIGQMRLTWWRDALSMPESERPEGEPLIALYNVLERDGLSSSNLLTMIDGWEILLEDFPWDDRQFDTYASCRGIGYFGFGLNQNQLSEEMAGISKIWALWDFALHCSDHSTRAEALQRCRIIWEDSGTAIFDRNGRPLSILCKLAMRDVKRNRLSETIYQPSTAAQVLWHGITGL